MNSQWDHVLYNHPICKYGTSIIVAPHPCGPLVAKRIVPFSNICELSPLHIELVQVYSQKKNKITMLDTTNKFWGLCLSMETQDAPYLNQKGKKTQK